MGQLCQEAHGQGQGPGGQARGPRRPQGGRWTSSPGIAKSKGNHQGQGQGRRQGDQGARGKSEGRGKQAHPSSRRSALALGTQRGQPRPSRCPDDGRSRPTTSHRDVGARGGEIGFVELNGRRLRVPIHLRVGSGPPLVFWMHTVRTQLDPHFPARLVLRSITDAQHGLRARPPGMGLVRHRPGRELRGSPALRAAVVRVVEDLDLTDLYPRGVIGSWMGATLSLTTLPWDLGDRVCSASFAVQHLRLSPTGVQASQSACPGRAVGNISALP